MTRRCLETQGRAGKNEFASEAESAERDETYFVRERKWKDVLERLLRRIDTFELDVGLRTGGRRWRDRF